ncbi:hypothetical protein GY45DRAFT_1065590 [Cubamyces sp. BRFM 1775]|nr:hypothetical protein GY45DRAFT_1065590 [Cubamyces sp. BRFM 1775]
MANCSSPSASDNFGTVVNAFSTAVLACNAAALARSTWMRYCPTQTRIDQLSEVVSHWRKWIDGVSPDERMRIEAQHPGFFDDMDKQLADADETMKLLENDYRAALASSWSVYYPLGGLGVKFSRTEIELRQRDAEFWTTTQRLRAAREGQPQATGSMRGTMQPPPPSAPPVPQVSVPRGAAPANTAALAQIQNRMTVLMSHIPLNHIRSYDIRSAVHGASAFVAGLIHSPQANIPGGNV